ncbi:MAG: coproporphyrinogen dehydrogenase HemZ [Lachnospiraceae bacterium]
MLIISLEEEKYEYDIRAIIKAFYPEKMVALITPSINPAKKADYLANISHAMQGMITFFEDKIEIELEGFSYFLKIKKDFTSLQYKDDFKEFLYQTLSQHKGVVLPWGNMTGIRPTKVATTMIQKNATDMQIREYYKGKHFVSDEKISLSIDIAHREHKLLSKLHCKDGFSLYIGIPFCPTTCLYCSFTSYPIGVHRKRVDRYIDCMIKEMDYVKEAYANKILDTVYIGGGTPTTLEANQMDRLIRALKERFDFSTVQEFTVEAGRADSITREKLEVLYGHDVNRISINPQTMHDKTLKIIGRNHTVHDVIEAYKLAREIGFDNINMDLILGLPGELEEQVRETIEQVVSLNPDSLTVHSLAIKRASNLANWIKEHDVLTLHNTDETMKIAVSGAQKLDMKPYYLYRQKNMSGNFENVGYAKDDKFGIYNILIMEEIQTIVALGAGSITKRVYEDGKIARCDNVKDVELYIERIEEMIERKRQLLEEQLQE